MNTAVATTPKKTLTNSIAKSEELVKLAEEITIISEEKWPASISHTD